MSCQLSAISKFHDITAVKRYFFPLPSKESTPSCDVNATTLSTSPSGEEEDNWNVDWDFDDQQTAPAQNTESEESSNESEDNNNKWLQLCLISLSPTNDVIAIAHENKICVMTQKWDAKNKGEEIDTRLVPVWETSFNFDDKETITAVLCLPLASQKRSTQGGPDWTCIIVGFSSGYIRMYSQAGVLLLSQLLHLERVERLKCRTYAPPRFLGTAEMHDELLIMYTKAIVSIDGFSLIQTLRACRNQVARATASGTENLLQPPPLAYKKWSLGEQDKVGDYVSCGVVCANPFDQLKAASILGGMKAAVKTSPPAMSVFLTSGSGPYVGFFYAIEGFAQPILSEVAIAMANKIKSALMSAASGWLGFGGKNKEEKEKPPKIELATPLPLRFGLPDKRRLGEMIILSPNNNFAATTDSFGRVILIDVQRGMAVRMWKGYRDAQLGWVEVREDSVERNADHYRLAQFLIIYAPRRGILEVWLGAHGPRVAAFNVSKSCRLVCPCYGMVGLNNVTCRGVRSRAFQVALIDPDGVIKTIDIPFHLALSDKSSKRARDLHLLKKLKTFLKESSSDREGLQETITELLLDLKVSSIAHQAIERVLSTRYLPVSVMQYIVKAAIKRLEAKGDESLDLDSRMMLKFCKAQHSLLALYSSVQRLNSGTVEQAVNEPSQVLTEILRLSPNEAASVTKSLVRFDALTAASTQQPEKSAKVTFAEDQPHIAATSFLHTFSYRTLFSSEEESSSASPSTGKIMQITVSKEASEERRLTLAEFLFDGCLSGRGQAQELVVALQHSGLPPDQLMNLLLLHWLSGRNCSLRSLGCLYELVKSITNMTDVSDVVVESNEHSAWWTRVRNMCCQASDCRAAYLAVLVCQAVAAHVLGVQHTEKDPDADSSSVTSDDEERHNKSDLDGDWEALTVDLESWEVLLRQCEDVMAIVTLLHIPAGQRLAGQDDVGQTGESPGTESEVIADKQERLNVSVSQLLHSGKGSVPEVIARYAVKEGLSPASLFYNYQSEESIDSEEAEKVSGGGDSYEKGEEQIEEDREAEGTDVSASEEERLEERIKQMSQSEKIKYQLSLLRRRFPHSLHNDVLLANCCWEYAVVWNKNPEKTQDLEFSLEFLRLVHNAVLRQGLSSLLWHMFIKKKASAAAHLMEKVGKPPKERLCRKEVSISDSALVAFISLCSDLMEIIMDANCEAVDPPVSQLEPAWQRVSGPTSLLELAVDQKATNYGLLRLHQHLLKVMFAVLKLGIKAKVLSLFDKKGRAAFFKELHSHPLLPSQKVENELVLVRQDFFCKVTTAAVSTMGPPAEATSSQSTPGSGQSLYKRQRSQFPEAFKWPQEVLSLAKDFGLDQDYLKRFHVCELYSFGHDRLAEEVMFSVNEQEEMGAELMTLAGKRLAYEIFKRDIDTNFQYQASMSPALTRWLQSLDTDSLHFPSTPLSAAVILAEHAASRLTEDSANHELSQELLEKTKMVADFQD